MKNDFSQIKRKIILQVITIGIITLIAGLLIGYFFIDGIFQAPFADAFISFCENVLHLDYYDASSLYQSMLRNNKPILMMGGFICLLFISFYFALTSFIKYFDQISKGVNELLNETDQVITMSPELSFMEKQLNEVKRTLKQRQEAALESEQRKNDLVMYLAHDIKTPLTSIIGYISLLDESPNLPVEQRQKYTAICLDKSYRLETLINEFFEITRFNLNEMVLEKENINLSFMFEQLVDEFYPKLLEKELEVELSYVGQIEYYGDSNKLARVFNNLLKNAATYSYPQSVIKIELIATSSTINIYFRNKGKVIPPHKLEMIFEKFYRLDSARMSNTGGAGLGLAISKDIVEVHGGTISAQSDEDETVFKVSLPLK